MKRLCLCLLLFAMAGCKSARHPNSVKSSLKTDPKADMPGAVTGTDWIIHWKALPQGKRAKKFHAPERMMDAIAQDGELDDTDNDDTIHLHVVTGTLYRNGKRAADVIADRVVASQQRKIVEGYGNVKITSITDPPDTVVTSDEASWDSKTGKIVATGNALLVRKTAGKKTLPIRQYGHRIAFDTALKEFDVR